MTKVRLNKFLSESGVCSRRAADELITQGRIEINGKVVTELGIKISPDKDRVTFDGEPVRKAKHVYYVFNKPFGYITTANDEKNRKTIFDIFESKERVFSVGRLDRDTTGILLLTNDGEFANLLTHPKNEVPREYIATLNKPFHLTGMNFNKEINLEDGVVKINLIKPFENDLSKVKIVLTEGRNRVVKRLFEKWGYEVKNLHRVFFAGFTVYDLPIGKWKKIPYSKIKKIYERYAKI